VGRGGNGCHVHGRKILARKAGIQETT
jgi:hypothetical protein